MKQIIRMTILAVLCVCLTGCALAESGGEWTCYRCGFVSALNYCPVCGTENPEFFVCPGCFTAYPNDGSVHFCSECGTSWAVLQHGRYEGEGFDSPEEAVTNYLNGLKNLSYDQILKSFAWETQAAHYSVAAQLNRIKVYNLSMRPRIPNINYFAEHANLQQIINRETDLLYRSIEACVMGTDYHGGENVMLKDEEAVTQFLETFKKGQLEKLTTLHNIRFFSADELTKGWFTSEKGQKNFAAMTAPYGGDEAVNVVALAELDGGEYLFCAPVAVRYGKKWYLASFTSVVSTYLGLSPEYHAFICVSASDVDLSGFLK